MKILLIHQYFLGKNQGSGVRFNQMTKVWADEGNSITVIAGMRRFSDRDNPNWKGKSFVHEKNFYKNTDVHRCYSAGFSNKPDFFSRMSGYFSFVITSIWAGLFKVKGEYDLMIVTSPPLFVAIPAYILSSVKRIPLIFEVRDLWPESAIDTGMISNPLLIKFSYWFEKTIYKKARLINVLTPAFREKLIEKKNIPAEKIIYIPNAADFSVAEEVAKNFNAQKFRKEEGIDDRFVITYIGAHGIANHLIQIIEAAEKLRDTNVLFQLIGSGPTKTSLVEEVKARNLLNIRFVDRVDKRMAFKYILASDVGTSVLKKVDTFKTIYSNKTFDYMSCKKPILLLIDGVSRQLVVEEAKCGVFAEPENAEDIAEKVRQFIRGDYDMKELGENGYQHAKKYFDRDKMAHKYLREMKRVFT